MPTAATEASADNSGDEKPSRTHIQRPLDLHSSFVRNTFTLSDGQPREFLWCKSWILSIILSLFLDFATCSIRAWKGYRWTCNSQKCCTCIWVNFSDLMGVLFRKFWKLVYWICFIFLEPIVHFWTGNFLSIYRIAWQLEIIKSISKFQYG